MSAIAIENLMFPINLDYSSNSFVEPIDKIEEQIINDSFLFLKNDIGEELFNKLSYDDKTFMVKTAGSIDFGHLVDLNKIAQNIKEYDTH